MALVLTEKRDSTGIIILNHAEKRNALSEALILEITSALEGFRALDIRAVVLRAQPGIKVWSAGHDVHELPACEVAMACDILVATPSASFAITPAKLGVPYNLGGLMTLVNMIPLPIVKEMLFTAQPLPVDQALNLGIINYVKAADEIESFVLGMATRIGNNSPLSIAVMKDALRLLSSAHAVTPDLFERIQGMRRVVYDSADYQEGIRAFHEKRKPEFAGK
jgi:methylmalonyl-CoA decarboxylase